MPRFTADGALLRPDSVERWVLVGTSLGLGYSNATDDGVGMFHRVYLEPRAYEHFLRTGGFRNGTMLALSIRKPVQPGAAESGGLVGGGTRSAGAGGEGSAAVPGRAGPTSTSVATRVPPGRCRGERCARCHAEHAARDNVFMQFYPQLRAR